MSTKAARLSLTELPADWQQFCAGLRPELDPLEVFAEFEDHFKSKSGKDGLKLDWWRTWRNWCRRTHASHANRAKVPNMQPVSQSRAALESLQKLKRGTEGKYALN